MKRQDLNDRHHALYRFFNADGVLLYIGITADLPARFKQHSKDKPWWHEVARIAVEPFPDRLSVLDAERRAIQAERPLWNVVHAVPSERAVAAPSVELVPVCDVCDRPILGSEGVLHVNTAAALTARSAKLARQQSDELFINVATLLLSSEDLPGGEGGAHWRMNCDECAHRADPERAGCHSCYWVDPARVSSYSDLLTLTAHLFEKDWVHHTDWLEFISLIGHGGLDAAYHPSNVAHRVHEFRTNARARRAELALRDV